MEGPNLAILAQNDTQVCLAHILAKRLHTVLSWNDSFVLGLVIHCARREWRPWAGSGARYP